MSFNIEFTAVVSEARKILDQEHLPVEVRQFISQGLNAFKDDGFVYVKAIGHLFNGDYQRSNADIVVQEVILKTARINDKTS